MILKDLKTPCALVHLDKLKANTARMAERMTGLGVRLRPHVKTHKCVEAARLQVKGHFGGITVSTMAEANFFALAGFRDITYAVPIATSRITDTVELTRGLDSFNLLLDHEQTFHELERCAREQQVRFSVFLKVDCGYHRAGVDPTREESVQLAASLAGSPNLDFRGLLTQAGHAYACRNADEIREVARQEREVTVGFAERLRRDDLDVPEVSVGSTPTISLTANLEGVTEARPGNYVFYDRFQASIGSCELSDAAFSVLVTVVGQYREPSRLIIDAGGLAFSKDTGPTHIDPDCGYGAFFSEDGTREYSELHLADLSQEHGRTVIKPPMDLESFPVGTRLQVVPNHSCLAAALFDRYHVIRGDEVIDEWRPVRGW